MNATQRIALQIGLNLIEIENLRDEVSSLRAQIPAPTGAEEEVRVAKESKEISRRSST